MANREPLALEYAPAEEGARVRRVLSKIDGLAMQNGYSGQYVGGPVSASVRIEGRGFFRVRQAVPSPPPAVESLRTHAALPGNVRFAVTGGQTSLVADTWLDGEAHLADSFREIRDGFHLALDRTWCSPRQGAPVVEKRVSDVLGQPPWDAETVVRLDDGWELRPRLRGEAAPVRLAVEGTSLRLTRVVLPDCPDDHRSAVALQALCWNGQWRLARLAMRGRAVVAETCLHAGLVSAWWLDHAARAVAVAAGHARTTTEILARQPDAARALRKMFLDEDRTGG